MTPIGYTMMCEQAAIVLLAHHRASGRWHSTESRLEHFILNVGFT